MKINYDQILIGQNEYGDLVTADMNSDGTIRTVNQYAFIGKDNTADGNNYIHCVGCGGNETVNNIEYDRGMKLAEDHEPFFHDDELKQIILDEDFYQADGSYCGVCGVFHDTEDSYNPTFFVLDYEIVCKTCADVDDIMVEVSDVDDIYKAKDIRGLELDGFEEVHTIFHDCGWGGPATDHKGATVIVDELLEEHGELFAGLTGIGQFQVYVTLYKRASQAKSA